MKEPFKSFDIVHMKQTRTEVVPFRGFSLIDQKLFDWQQFEVLVFKHVVYGEFSYAFYI